MMCSDPAALSGEGSRPCTALNRPYSHHCRRCGAPLLSRRRARTIAERWRKAGQFDEADRLSSAPADRPGSALGETACVTQLQDLEGARPPRVLLEWKFVDGVLAVHQGGGFMALVNPFGNLTDDGHPQLPIWTQPEEPHVEVRDVPYEAQLFRPYPPSATSDRRYLFFSTPYAAFALDLCSLPGWAAGNRNADFRTLVDCTPGLDPRIAAAPIPLAQDPYRVGVLLYHAGRDEYRWLVRDVAGGSVARPQPGDGEGVVLPMHGSPCQYALVGDRVIALSTNREHWLWRFSDALAGKADSMVCTWLAGDSGGTVCLDYHVQDRRRFSWARQNVCFNDPLLASDGFEWYYQSSPDGIQAGQLEYYYVPLGTLSAQLPTRATIHSGALPLGPWRPPGAGGMLEMLFLDAAGGGELYRCPGGVAPLNFLDILMDFNKIVGLWLCDPLLTVLANDSTHEHCWEITILSLQERQQRIRAGQLRLRADPLVWARWLFTCQLDGANLAIYRTEIPIANLSEEEA